jgi:4-amino-4-deoxy-L-arabinose transferase-like glycosyltransferase
MSRTPLNPEQRLIRAAMLFLMLGLLIKILAMPLVPVNWDSNYYLNIGSNFIERGELTPYMWRLGADTTIIAGSGTGYGVLLLTFWFKIFGLSLYAGYALMYMLGVLSLIVLYGLARAWWQSPAAALVAVVFTGLTGSFIAQFYIRMDAPAVLTYLLILWLHLYAVKSNRHSLHFAVGVALILGAEVHIQILLYIAAISFYYLLEQLRFIRQQRRIFVLTPSIAYFAGALCAGVIYLLIHVVPDPQAYFIIARDCPNCQPAGLVKELQRYILYIFERSPEGLIFCIALGAAYVRRSTADKHYFTLLIGYLLGQAIISPPVQVEYLSHLLPLIGLGVGGVFVKADETQRPITQAQLTIGIFAASFLFLSQLAWLFINSANPQNTPESVEYVREFIADDVVVMGSPPLYHHLLDYDRFLSYDSGEQYGITLRGEDYLSFWEREQPQVFIGSPDGDAWWTYMHTHHFQQVREDLWLAGDMLATLTLDQAIPQITFTALQEAVPFGDCTTLSWSVAAATEVRLNGASTPSTTTQAVCPYTTTRYTLAAFWVGGIETAAITIAVE